MSTADLPAPPASAPRSARRLLVILPLLVFVGLGGLLFNRLGAGDPSRLPSALIGHPVPQFTLGPLPGRTQGESTGLSTSDLEAGHVTLLNVFASWCSDCHDEHALLMALAQDPALKSKGVRLDGMVYKDNFEDARRYLGQLGDPYRRIGDDRSGRTGIDFGVYGVPETFVIRGDGTIAYKLIGPVTPNNLPKLMAEVDAAASTATAK